MVPVEAVSKARRKEGSGGGGRSIIWRLLLISACCLLQGVGCGSTSTSSSLDVKADAAAAAAAANELGEGGGEDDGDGMKNATNNPDNLAGIPRCAANTDCVANGVCHRGTDGYGRCLCPGACPGAVPQTCNLRRRGAKHCPKMDPAYTAKYTISQPLCHQNSCACPPQFEPSPTAFPFKTEQKMLPIKCDKREIAVRLAAIQSASIYRGQDLTLVCCINMDPSGLVTYRSVQFLQNMTVGREFTASPFDSERKYPPWCWGLRIPNAQFMDAGSYACQLTWDGGKMVEDTIEVTVKAPRSIQDFNVTVSTGSAELTWALPDREPPLVIELRLLRRTDTRGLEVWTNLNATSPQPIADLRPATPYTVLVSVIDGTSDPYKFSQNFQTKEARPQAPKPEDVRVQQEGSGEFCEVEWRAPPITNGRITHYYVRVEGALRYSPGEEDGEPLALIDYPLATDGKCANFDSSERSTLSINPIEYPGDFFSCKYGPLKPNRNYSVTMWSQNSADRSYAHNFTKSCMTDYDKPEIIEHPSTRDAQNGTQFALRFQKPVDETRGPISCYYIAVVPLPSNASIELLPPPSEITMDTAANAYANNLSPKAAATKRYSAYIAESYSSGGLPRETVIGDEQPAADGAGNCSLNFLGRLREEDGQLRAGLKYTGFIVVRVDRIGRGGNGGGGAGVQDTIVLGASSSSSESSSSSSRIRRQSQIITPNHPFYNLPLGAMAKRQLAAGSAAASSSTPQPVQQQPSALPSTDPVYGYSAFFKPVFLRTSDDASIWTLIGLAAVVCLLVVSAMVGGSVAAHRLGLVSSLCPLKKGGGGGGGREGATPLSTGASALGMGRLSQHHHSAADKAGRVQLARPGAGGSCDPIPVDCLPEEFIIKHRDSDYLFTQEFEALPNPKLPATASVRNAAKNRYKDIVAFDETRVKLRRLNGIETSDYMNANWIKSYGDRKRFIASQAPLETTLTDFWRMIWETDVRLVVMLSNLVERERNQSAKYWPNELSTPQPQYVGDFSIVSCGQQYMADHTVRLFDVTYQGPPATPVGGSTRASPEATGSITSEYANVPSSRGSIGAVISEGGGSLNGEAGCGGAHFETRRIAQYHFTAWSDYKAPECPTVLLRFLMKLRALHEFNHYPVLVHCSAGVGRTGTLIAIDSLIDQCRERKHADVFGFVAGMRKQRNLMVQNTEQYVFIYRALAEHQLFGVSDRSAEEFARHWREIKGRQALREEFERLKTTLETPPRHTFADASPDKNRYAAAVPYDNKRVVLAPFIGGHADSQYINASTVKGHFYPYILAQDPLGKDTVFDFWRMVIDHKVATLVCLTPEHEFEEEEKYWPRESGAAGARTINHITVTTLREEQWPQCRQRTMTYQFNSEKPRTVVQYSLAGWQPGRARPDNPQAMMAVIGRVLERQSGLADEEGDGARSPTPILLHSRNGSTECGVLCAISLLIERLKAEERVDVFQTVHAIKHTRPQTFVNIDEYEFVYETIHNVIRHR